MELIHGRISENVLFTLLLAALAGCITAPVAADLQSSPLAGTCLAACVPVQCS